MIVLKLADVLQPRISFILPTSVRLSMKDTLFTTVQNGIKLEFENFTYTKNVKMKTLKSRREDARINVARVPARPIKVSRNCL